MATPDLKKHLVTSMNSMLSNQGLRELSTDTESYSSMMSNAASKLYNDLTSFEEEIKKAQVLVDLGLDNGSINKVLEAIEEEKESLSKITKITQRKIQKLEATCADSTSKLSSFYDALASDKGAASDVSTMDAVSLGTYDFSLANANTNPVVELDPSVLDLTQEEQASSEDQIVKPDEEVTTPAPSEEDDFFIDPDDLAVLGITLPEALQATPEETPVPEMNEEPELVTPEPVVPSETTPEQPVVEEVPDADAVLEQSPEFAPEVTPGKPAIDVTIDPRFKTPEPNQEGNSNDPTPAPLDPPPKPETLSPDLHSPDRDNPGQDEDVNIDDTVTEEIYF